MRALRRRDSGSGVVKAQKGKKSGTAGVRAGGAKGSGCSAERKKSGAKEEKGRIEIRIDFCKSCGLCVEACPQGLIEISPELNDRGYHPARCGGNGCTGCGLCYLNCPEPACITVYRRVGK